MSDDHDKPKPIEPKRDAGDSTKHTTSQKTATESITDETRAKGKADIFESFSEKTKALSQHDVAKSPLVLHDSSTGEVHYDASKRHAKVLNRVTEDDKAAPSKDDTGAPHLKAGERLLQMERALLADKSHVDVKDASSVSHKIPTLETRPAAASPQVVRRNERTGSAPHESDSNHEVKKLDTPHEKPAHISDTTRGANSGPIKQEFSAWIPDYKTAGVPGAIPKFVEVHMSQQDNFEIEKHFRKSLEGKDEGTLSDFDKSKLKNLAICDVAIDKYQSALTLSELNDTRSVPDQLRGLMLASAALQDGSALGATKAVLHKVIEGGAIGDLADGTALGLVFGKVVATLAANVNPWTRFAAGALRAGGVAVALAELSHIGSESWDGLTKSVPALEEVCKHPSEKSFAAAKTEIEKNLGNPLADVALVGLGFAAAHGIEKVIPGGGKPGVAHEGESRASGSQGDHHVKESISKKESDTRADRLEESKAKDTKHENTNTARSEYSCENKTEDGYRILRCGEHEERMILHGGWFHSIPKTHVDAHSPIKVHVLTDSAFDLGNIQRALIPELMRDPILTKHVGKWKGQDPNIGFKGEGHSNAVEPTGRGQGAKAFTIYTETAEDAMIVQKRIDNILFKKGLGLKQEIQTGNTEVCPGLSKRASICRDTFAQGSDPTGHPGPIIDEPVAAKINSSYHLKPGDKLSNEQLRDLETRTGVLKGAITYTTDGKLMLKGYGGQTKYHGGYYATESGVDTSMGKMIERPAMYSIYRICGINPCDPAIIWKK